MSRSGQNNEARRRCSAVCGWIPEIASITCKKSFDAMLALVVCGSNRNY
uniref:Uncharacterized protein n=2 Tax=Caenorhabditis japonica TaxID=281687 RepID=A0A8R1EBH2_CAEJA